MITVVLRNCLFLAAKSLKKDISDVLMQYYNQVTKAVVGGNTKVVKVRERLLFVIFILSFDSQLMLIKILLHSLVMLFKNRALYLMQMGMSVCKLCLELA